MVLYICGSKFKMKSFTKLTAQKILTFKKWGRKSYSVFCTVNRVIQISVLSVIYFLFSPIVTRSNENDTTEVKIKYNLDEIEVSAQRSPALYSQVARIVSVIDRKEIEASPSQSVQELLEYIAGVDVRQRGSEGVQADISIRGSTFDQIIILLNGINITDPQTGHHNLNVPIGLSQIEQIEILEGPAARIYGPNAFAGAINIITRSEKSTVLETNFTSGSFQFLDFGVFGNLAEKKSSHSISANKKKSGGYINNTDFETATLFYSSKFQIKKSGLITQAGFANKQFGANGFYTPKYPNQFEQTRTFFSSVKWNSNSKLNFTPAIYFRQHSDRFELFRENPAAWYTNHNYHLTQIYGGNANVWKQWIGGKTSTGFEFRSENILSNVLGETISAPIKIKGENAEYTKSKSRVYYSAFFEHVYYYRNFSFTAGVLGNYIPENNIGLKFFPGFDFSFNISENLKTYVSWNSSLRLPTFTDLYYKGPTNIGNPGLKPEESATAEWGIKLNQKYIRGHFVYFFRRGSNIIDWVKEINDEVWQPRNLTQIENRGVEFFVQILPAKKWGYPFPEKVSVSYFSNSVNKHNFDFVSNYALDHLNFKWVFGIQQKISKQIFFDFRSVYQDRAGTYTGFENGAFGSEIEYKPFVIFDGKLTFSSKRISFFTSATNLFNKKYYDIGNVIQPGRWVKAGIQYNLSFTKNEAW